MENKNLILLNMLKQQLLTVYQTFVENPALLDDPYVNKAYEALQTCTDHKEMKQWGKMMESLGLSYTNSDDAERYDNVLGELDDLLSRADWDVMDDFISWKCSFGPSQWEEMYDENCNLVRRIEKMAERSYDVHIILVNCAGHWVAIAEDADRLFEIFGWQTSVVNNGDYDLSFMFVSEYGCSVLEDSDYSVKYLYLSDEGGEDEVFFSDCFNEDMVCAQQQLIDYIRLILKKQGGLQNLMSEKSRYYLPMSGYDYLVNASISVKDDKVIASTDEGEEVTLADGRSWRLDEVGMPYYINFRTMIGDA